MADSWATSAELHDVHRSLDLHVDVRAGTRGAGAALIRSLRDAVRTGRLAPGTRLPSSRALAADLGVARNTVADAYTELVAEGWLTARQGSGTRVAARSEPRRARARAATQEPPPHPLDRQATYNLLPGAPDAARFPRAAWAAAARRALLAAPSAAFGHQGPGGRVELRRALAGYLARARGVYAEPARIVVCAGFTGGLRLLAEVLRAEGARRVAVEPYGLGLHRRLITGAGLRTVPLPYDDGGIATAALPATGAGAVLLTPAHQFPTGVALAPERRAAAVDWARATGGVVLEDDYDGEFRYDRHRLGRRWRWHWMPCSPEPFLRRWLPATSMPGCAPRHGGRGDCQQLAWCNHRIIHDGPILPDPAPALEPFQKRLRGCPRNAESDVSRRHPVARVATGQPDRSRARDASVSGSAPSAIQRKGGVPTSATEVGGGHPPSRSVCRRGHPEAGTSQGLSRLSQGVSRDFPPRKQGRP